jgi:hypothetical protein
MTFLETFALFLRELADALDPQPPVPTLGVNHMELIKADSPDRLYSFKINTLDSEGNFAGARGLQDGERFELIATDPEFAEVFPTDDALVFRVKIGIPYPDGTVRPGYLRGILYGRDGSILASGNTAPAGIVPGDPVGVAAITFAYTEIAEPVPVPEPTPSAPDTPPVAEPEPDAAPVEVAPDTLEFPETHATVEPAPPVETAPVDSPSPVETSVDIPAPDSPAPDTSTVHFE